MLPHPLFQQLARIIFVFGISVIFYSENFFSSDSCSSSTDPVSVYPPLYVQINREHLHDSRQTVGGSRGVSFLYPDLRLPLCHQQLFLVMSPESSGPIMRYVSTDTLEDHLIQDDVVYCLVSPSLSSKLDRCSYTSVCEQMDMRPAVNWQVLALNRV